MIRARCSPGRQVPVWWIATLIAFLGCEKADQRSALPDAPPLPDVRYEFQGDVVGRTTTAEFEKRHAGQFLSVEGQSLEELLDSATYLRVMLDVFHCSDVDSQLGSKSYLRLYSQTSRQPMFGGRPSNVMYVFSGDILELIAIGPVDSSASEGGQKASMTPLREAREKFGPPTHVSTSSSGELTHWDSRWSSAALVFGHGLLISDSALSEARIAATKDLKKAQAK